MSFQKLNSLNRAVLVLVFFGFSVFAAWGNDITKDGISFRDAAAMAVASSADLRYELAMRVLRERKWTLGLRAFFPSFGLSASEDDRLSQNGTDAFQKIYSVSVDQLLWDGGRTSTARIIEKAELALLGTELERYGAGIADNALKAYRNVLSARAFIEIRSQALLSLEEQRRILASEIELGLALNIDLVEAEINVNQARLELGSLETNLKEAEQLLALSLGLDSLPPLNEKVDILRRSVLPSLQSVTGRLETKNPELVSSRYSIAKRQAETKYASRSWIPTLLLSAAFNMSGRRYPLSRYSWSLGLTVNFSSPWLSGGLSVSHGREPPFDTTAKLGGSANPLPDPAAEIDKRSMEAALALEKEKYTLMATELGRRAFMALEKCVLLNKRCILSREIISLAEDKLRLMEVRLGLGQVSRIDLMETRIEMVQKEINAVETAVALLEAERELEQLLDLAPGTLGEFARHEGVFEGSV